MRSRLFLLLFVTLLTSCEKSNQELYDDVMTVHDEVMPKMDQLYTRKIRWRAIANDSTKSIETRQKAESMVVRLDSASESMMLWMREFNPPADTVVGEAKAREYLEGEMVKVSKMRDQIYRTLKTTELD